MKIQLGDKVAQVSIHHLSKKEFKEKFPLLREEAASRPKRVTVCELTYDGVTARAVMSVHTDDEFIRFKGSSLALSRAMQQHPSLQTPKNGKMEEMKAEEGMSRKKLRTELFARMFRSEPSPYNELLSLVRSRPELARALTKMSKSMNNNAEEILKLVEKQ